MAGTLRVRRSRGAFSGVLLILLGLWGGLVPLVGPYLHYAYQPDKAWTITSGRIWLELVPAAGAIVGGVMLLASKLRPFALFGAVLAAVSGGWFALASVVVRFWMKTPPAQGTPVGGEIARAAEQLGFFTGLGVVIVCVAAVAIGRFSVISVRDSRLAERAAERAAMAADLSATDITTTPLPARTGVESVPPQATSPTPRKAPMAAFTRIASRGKSAGQSFGGDAESGSAKSADHVGSATRRS